MAARSSKRSKKAGTVVLFRRVFELNFLDLEAKRGLRFRMPDLFGYPLAFFSHILLSFTSYRLGFGIVVG